MKMNQNSQKCLVTHLEKEEPFPPPKFTAEPKWLTGKEPRCLQTGAFLVPGPLTYPASLPNAIRPLISTDSSEPKINTLMTT